MTDMPWFVEGVSPDGVTVRGTHTDYVPGTDGPGTAWWASVDGQTWVLGGTTTHDDIERVFPNAPLLLVAKGADMFGWAWGEVTTVREAVERMDLTRYRQVGSIRLVDPETGGTIAYIDADQRDVDVKDEPL
jgi:hypothetical protein